MDTDEQAASGAETERPHSATPAGGRDPLPCLEDETDFTEPRYYAVEGQPVMRRDRDSLPIGFQPGGAEEPVPYGIWAYTGRTITITEFQAMRDAQDAGLAPTMPVPPINFASSLIPPPPLISFIEGQVTGLLRRGFVLEDEQGQSVRVATQVRGRQISLRAGDRVRVSGGFDRKGIFLSAWAAKTGADGKGGDVPVSRDDLRRQDGEATGSWWRFWRRR